MKYILFAGEHCYPAIGFYDRIGEYETILEAKAAFANDPFNEYDWAHIVKIDGLEVVWYFHNDDWIEDITDDDSAG